jgi:hypothetical protein
MPSSLSAVLHVSEFREAAASDSEHLGARGLLEFLIERAERGGLTTIMIP